MKSRERVIESVSVFQKSCKHNKFKIDSELSHVKCGLCGESLSPMWVLGEFAKKEHRLFIELDRLEKLVEITKDKTKCKCDKCGEITSIANNSEMAKARN